MDYNTPSSNLPYTGQAGPDLLIYVIVALLLLAAGVALHYQARRR